MAPKRTTLAAIGVGVFLVVGFSMCMSPPTVEETLMQKAEQAQQAEQADGVGQNSTGDNTTDSAAGDASAGGQADGSASATNGDASDVTETTLFGRWRVPEPENQDAYVEFAQYGLWVATDGCNALTGTWAVEPGGVLRAGSNGVMGSKECDNVDVPQAVLSAKTAAIDQDGNLVLIDSSGAKTVLVSS